MQQFDITNLLVQLAEALSPLLVALVSWAAYQGALWLKHRVEADRAHMAIDMAQLAVVDTVAAGGAAFALALREAAADGVVTPEELAEIRQRTLAAAKSQAGDSVMAALKKVHGDPDTWLWTKIKAEAQSTAPVGVLGSDPTAE